MWPNARAVLVTCDHCIFVTYFHIRYLFFLVILKPILLTLSLSVIHQSTRLYIYKDGTIVTVCVTLS